MQYIARGDFTQCGFGQCGSGVVVTRLNYSTLLYGAVVPFTQLRGA